MSENIETHYSAPAGSHQLAELNQMKNEKLKAAFGIKDSYADGSSFSSEYQAAKKETDKLEREQRRFVHILQLHSVYTGRSVHAYGNASFPYRLMYHIF